MIRNGCVTRHGWCRIFTVVLLLFFAAANTFAADRKVTIIKSSNNSYFQQTIETIKGTIGNSVTVEITDVDAIETEQKSVEDSDLIITLGNRAAQKVNQDFENLPVIHAYVTLKQQQAFPPNQSNRTTVLLNQPISRYLAFSRYLLDIQSIGIMSQSRLILNQTQDKILEELKLSLNQYQLKLTDSLLTSLRRLLKQNDALLMLPDQSIYNRDTLKGVLLTSYRHRIPVISYSPAHVKSGALASIYSSPTDIGNQIGELLNDFLIDSRKFRSRTLFASYYSIATNMKVARALNLNLPDEGKLREKIGEFLK